MSDNNQQLREKEFLTDVFMLVAEKSAPTIGVRLSPERAREAAAAQTQHFCRDYK